MRSKYMSAAPSINACVHTRLKLPPVSNRKIRHEMKRSLDQLEEALNQLKECARAPPSTAQDPLALVANIADIVQNDIYEGDLRLHARI